MQQVDLDTVLTEAAQHGASIDTICIQFPVSRFSPRFLGGCFCICVEIFLVYSCQVMPPRLGSLRVIQSLEVCICVLVCGVHSGGGHLLQVSLVKSEQRIECENEQSGAVCALAFHTQRRYPLAPPPISGRTKYPTVCSRVLRWWCGVVMFFYHPFGRIRTSRPSTTSGEYCRLVILSSVGCC